MRRSINYVFGALAALLSPAGFVAAQERSTVPERPNVVFILLDDVRADELGCTGHPFAKTPHIDRIAREGARFTNAFVTIPLCSPSRASFLTGQYAHTHGVKDNGDHAALSHKLRTFPRLLHETGYRTAFIGKWHMGSDDRPRPGFDTWVAFPGQGHYVNPTLNINGQRQVVEGYATDILNSKALEFLRQKHDRPFLLYLSHKALHPDVAKNSDGSVAVDKEGLFRPAERHRSLYEGAVFPRRPNANFDVLEGKPALTRPIGKLPPLSRKTGTSDEVIRNRARMLAAVDEGVGEIFQALEDSKTLDSTIVVLTSDHGYFFGEHGLSVERRLAYEEAIRIPLLIRYPPLIKPGTVYDQTVLSIDLAPTLLDLGGVRPPPNMHGRSFIPLFSNPALRLRQSILIEYFSDTVFKRMDRMGYQAVRTPKWKYIAYTELEGMDELYNLEMDPYEQKNLIRDPQATKLLAEARAELQRLLEATR